MPFINREGTVQQCRTCSGSGQCQACDGEGRGCTACFKGRCAPCGGSGVVVARRF
ncbi:MAG: hypothetical protein AB7R89_03475 [Dehalococcoidia bacterium]